MHVVEILEATIGGTRTHMLQILEGLDRRRFRLTLVASAERDPRFRQDMERLEAAGIGVVEVPMARRIAPLRDAAALLRLCRVLRSLKPDVVHTHSSKAGVLGRIAARLCGIETVVHTPHVFYFQGRRGLSRRAFRLVERALLPLTSRLVLLTDAQRLAAAEELGPRADRVETIPNGVDAARFSPRGDRERARLALGLGKAGPVVGTITRFMPQKNSDLFVEAMAAVVSEMPDVRVVLVGSGPLRDRALRLARRLGLSESLVWRERAEDPRDIYEALDLFVLSSRYEGMPCVLLEAMAMGLPVVATRFPGADEVVKPGESGLLVAPDDPAGLARAVRELLRDPECARRMGAEGRRIVERDFPLHAFLGPLAELYAGRPRA